MENFINLNNNPMLRELLKLYISIKYENEATYDDYGLFKEYVWLKDNNKLNELFIKENLLNRMDDENYTG